MVAFNSYIKIVEFSSIKTQLRWTYQYLLNAYKNPKLGKRFYFIKETKIKISLHKELSNCNKNVLNLMKNKNC